MNPIALLLPFPAQIEEENFSFDPISSEDFALFLMREASLLKEKGSDQSDQTNQLVNLVNDPAPSMIAANLFSPVIAQEDAFIPARFFETQPTEKILLTPILSSPKGDPILPLKQEERCTDSTQYGLSLGKGPGNPNPSDAEKLGLGELLPNPLPNQKNLISEIPLPKQSAVPEAVGPEPSGSPVSPAAVPGPPSSMKDLPFISTPSQEMEPRVQNLIAPQPQQASTEKGFTSTHAFVPPSLDPSWTEPLSSDLPKPPLQTVDFRAMEPPFPPERMSLGEENRLHRDGAFMVHPSNKEIFIGESLAPEDDGSSSNVQNSAVYSQGRTEQSFLAKNLSQGPLPGGEESPVLAQGRAEQGLVDKSIHQEPLSDGPNPVRRTVFSQSIPIDDSVFKNEKGDPLKEGAAFHQHPKAVEAMPQKNEKFAFQPEAPLTIEKRGATVFFEQGGEERKTDPWAKNGGATLPGTKEGGAVGPSGMFMGAKPEAELHNQVPKGVSEGQGGPPPKAESVEVFQQIAKKVVWCIRNNEEKIKLALEPPELGNIYMEINRKEKSIRTTLWADNPATKGILEANQIQIFRIFEKDGFHLEKFTVFLHQGSESFQERGEKSIEYGRWERGRYEEGKGALSEEPFEIDTVMNLPHRGSQYIDLFV